MKISKWIFAALLCGGWSFAQANRWGTKIVGGIEATRGEFPFIVSLQVGDFGHICGGSLIEKNWVLTAAHCVDGEKSLKVVIGLHDQTDMKNTESFISKRLIMHPQYNSEKSDYDYALIELNGSSKFPTVALNSSELPIEKGVLATVAGWGLTSENEGELPNILRKVEVPLVTREICNQSYNGQITERMICGGLAVGGKDSCQGDSGGPLVTRNMNGNWLLAGVVSWGEGCARARYFGVYSNVSQAVDWITNTIQH